MPTILEKPWTHDHFDRIASVSSQFLSVLVSSSLHQMIIIISTSKKTGPGLRSSNYSYYPSQSSGGLGRSMEVIWFVQCKFWARSCRPGPGLSIWFMAIHFHTAISVFTPSNFSHYTLATYANEKWTEYSVLSSFGSFLYQIPTLCFICICLFLKQQRVFRKECMYS